ncbi:MAG: hypothetical protein FJ086_04340 [Deltaproteobacteria bacterium]|nr:hypothetical protein [Deltaproteobacteria bacterium]
MAGDDDRLKPGGDAAEAIKECDAFEEEVAALKVAYEQFFMGLEKKPPLRQHEELKKRLNHFRARPHRAVAVKFRVGSLHQKFQTYERLWERTLKEIENGTYTRDLQRARKKVQAAEAKKRKGPEVLRAGGESLEEAMAAAAAAVEQRTLPVVAPLGALPKVPGVPGGLPGVAPLAGTPKVPAPLPGTLPGGVPGLPAPVAGLPKLPGVSGSFLAVPAPSGGLPRVPGVSGSFPAVPAPSGGLPRVPGVSGSFPAVPAAAAGLPKVPGVSGSFPSVPAPSGGFPRVPPVAASLPVVPPAAGLLRPPAVAAPAAPQPRPAPAAASNGGDLSDAKVRAVYDAYVAAKRQGGEDTSRLSFEAVAQSLRKQVPELLAKTKAKSVEFKVVVKDGKAQLKAVPKE